MKNTDGPGELSFRVMEEEASINKQVVEQAKVRITKKVHEEEEHVDVSSSQEEVEVHKVVINKYVDAMPETRYEGNTMIVPVMKEVVVVEKRLLLAEEIHITKHKVTSAGEKIIPVLREEVHVERITKDEIKEKL